MRFSGVVCALLFASLPTASAGAQSRTHTQPDWQTYVVQQFGTTIDFPAGIFVLAGKPEKGVGQSFKSVDGRAVLSIYALANSESDTPARYLEKNLRVLPSSIQYRRVAGTFFAISMERDGIVYYSRCNFWSAADRSIHCFDLSYPQQLKRDWDPIATRMSLSLRPLQG
jgi:hypothetical protein